MRIAAVVFLFGSLCLAACDDTNNDVIVAPGSRTGTFILQTVNGHELPAIAVDSISPPLAVEVTSGAIAIGPNDTFVDLARFRFTLGDIVSTRTVACGGTFTVVADTLTFAEFGSTPDCGRIFTGILRDNSLAASLRGLPAIYAR
jgi:hypothetical protein